VSLAGRVAATIVALAAVGVFAAPVLSLRAALGASRACFAAERAPRGPALPSCAPHVRDYDFATPFPWTHHDATYHAEELLVRDAVARYMNAAVGDPDPARLAAESAGALRVQRLVERGSRRVSFEELGPAIAAPNLGDLAARWGDRGALVDGLAAHPRWDVRLAVLEAALLEADFEEVERVALELADADPREADLRAATGAALCVVGAREGLALLETIPDKRAEARSANIQRDYGEVLAVLESCARALDEKAPPRPTRTHAGRVDVEETVLATELRTLPPERLEGVLETIAIRLGSAGRGVDARFQLGRATLLAGYLARHAAPDPTRVAELVAAGELAGEGALAPSRITARTLLDEGTPLAPTVPLAWLDRAPDALAALTERAPDEATRSTLARASASLALVAAIEHARLGDPELAVALVDRAARGGAIDREEATLAAASAAWIAGDPSIAIERITADFPNGSEPTTPDVAIALATLSALAHASRGQVERARTEAERLDALAARAEDPAIAIDARWTAAALAAPRAAPANASPASASPTKLLAWTGMADPAARWRERAPHAIASTLAAVRAARGLSDEERRAFRYTFAGLRGDAPALLVPFALAAGELLGPGASHAAAETWLDAALAREARRLPLRTIAFARSVAAHARGDTESAALWEERLAVLRAVVANPSTLEAARYLRL